MSDGSKKGLRLFVYEAGPRYYIGSVENIDYVSTLLLYYSLALYDPDSWVSIAV